ncbi:MAG: penicillin-binding protein 2 [Candidatus Spechtbacterales bacterium]|nr:penicillin-binding protein 2 [Candidatus Spechtbacterales bacterium]
MSIFKRIKRAKHPSDLRVPINASGDITPEDVFSDVASPLSGEADDNKLEVPVNPLSTRIFFLCIFGILLFLGAYTLFISLTEGTKFKNLAEANAQRVHQVGASRGQIVSSDGEVLAYSEVVFNLSINPSKSTESDIDGIASILSDTFEDFSYDYLYERMKSAKERDLAELLLMKNLTEEEVSEIKYMLEEFPVLSLAEHPLRVYPYDNLFSHLMGFTASVTPEELSEYSGYTLNDNIGKKGIEFYFERFLKGKKGLFAKFVSATGDVIREKLLRSAELGASIELTLDSHIQAETHRILEEALITYGIDSAAAVVQDPNTGNILAMVSLPDFNPNHFARGLTNDQVDIYFEDPDNPLFSRVTSGEYATGSVIKPLIAASALEEGIISPGKIINTHGYITVPSVYDPSVVYRFNDWKNHGPVDMREAIAVSSNVYFYTIGGGYQEQRGLGIDKIAEYLSEFGWGSKLGINFAAEEEGLVPTPEWKRNKKDERWSIGDTYNVSIGQGDILATPLQVAAATSVFANGGTLYRPNVVSKIYTQDNVIQEVKNSDIINDNFLEAESLNVVREGMRRAILIGSGVYLQQLPVSVAGKTGTAQTSGIKNNAWFTGFAPYEDPEVTVTVLLEEGQSSNNAVRVAKEIFDVYFKDRYPELYPEPVEDIPEIPDTQQEQATEPEPAGVAEDQ